MDNLLSDSIPSGSEVSEIGYLTYFAFFTMVQLVKKAWYHHGYHSQMREARLHEGGDGGNRNLSLQPPAAPRHPGPQSEKPRGPTLAMPGDALATC